MDGIDLSWAHPALAKSAGRIFRRIRRDDLGRLSLADMRRSFGRHAGPMLEEPVYRDGSGWAFLGDRWQAVLKDWGTCAGVSMWCIGGPE